MQFRDLKRQYQNMKPQIDATISEVVTAANFISGKQVKELEILDKVYLFMIKYGQVLSRKRRSNGY